MNLTKHEVEALLWEDIGHAYLARAKQLKDLEFQEPADVVV